VLTHNVVCPNVLIDPGWYVFIEAMNVGVQFCLSHYNNPPNQHRSTLPNVLIG